MSMNKLLEKIAALQNPAVAGLDPRLDYVPEYMKKAATDSCDDPFGAAAQALLDFNKGLIDVLWDIVPAVKPQTACYEMYGWQGMRALAETVSYAHEKGMYVIIDGKRNDIGSTMEAYATAYLGKTVIGKIRHAAFDGDCLTVNGYLGSDGVIPLLTVCREEDKGIFVLTKTSNPSSGELQDQKLGEKTVCETMAKMCEEWGKQAPGAYGYTSVGAVVGATWPKQLKDLRQQSPHTFFLVPGYGAQGGGAEDVIHAFDQNGLGAVINSSRSIMCAYRKENCDERDYAKAARREALRMKADIMSKIKEIRLP